MRKAGPLLLNAGGAMPLFVMDVRGPPRPPFHAPAVVFLDPWYARGIVVPAGLRTGPHHSHRRVTT